MAKSERLGVMTSPNENPNSIETKPASNLAPLTLFWIHLRLLLDLAMLELEPSAETEPVFKYRNLLYFKPFKEELTLFESWFRGFPQFYRYLIYEDGFETIPDEILLNKLLRVYKNILLDIDKNADNVFPYTIYNQNLEPIAFAKYRITILESELQSTQNLDVYFADISIFIDYRLAYRGFGFRILEGLIERIFSTEIRVKEIRLFVYPDNKVAVKTYLKLGFRPPEGEFKDWGTANNQWSNILSLDKSTPIVFYLPKDIWNKFKDQTLPNDSFNAYRFFESALISINS